jgi:hypothetical protein
MAPEFGKPIHQLPLIPANVELKGWRVEILSASEGTSGGYKEIVAEIAGRGDRRPSA